MHSDELIFSSEMVFLLTSIPTGFAVSTIDELLADRFGDDDQQLNRQHVTELLKLSVSTFFKFNDQVYEQKKETLMRSPPVGAYCRGGPEEARATSLTYLLSKTWTSFVHENMHSCGAAANIEHMPNIKFVVLTDLPANRDDWFGCIALLARLSAINNQDN
ncbi:unnamed protein product [Dibothriocephalus latus]|uniref:Uncharacterized protein n=1 Tax=Dibothriocephalus latus TaxID=60516 RepID=A0A3P6UIY6_DIBLA|nr:unnamed protein product [Dibothriocephalus latus]